MDETQDWRAEAVRRIREDRARAAKAETDRRASLVIALVLAAVLLTLLVVLIFTRGAL